MVFTDVVFADGAFHTLVSSLDASRSPVPADATAFNDKIVSQVGLLWPRLAHGDGRLVAAGVSRNKRAIAVNEDGQTLALGDAFGSNPLAIRYDEEAGVFELYVIHDELSWVKYRLDGDLHEVEDPVVMPLPKECAMPAMGILDLLPGDDAVWGTAELDVSYLQQRSEAGPAPERAVFRGWMTRGPWTVGLMSVGAVAVDHRTNTCWLITQRTLDAVPRVAVDDQGEPRLAISMAGDGAFLTVEQLKQGPLSPVEAEDPGPGPVAGQVEQTGAQYSPERAQQYARERAVVEKEATSIQPLLLQIVELLQNLVAQNNIMAEAHRISLGTIDRQLVELLERGLSTCDSMDEVRTALGRGYVGPSISILGKTYTLTLVPKPYATDPLGPDVAARPITPDLKADDHDRESPRGY